MKDYQDVALAKHAESYIKQQQQNQRAGGTKSGLENRQSKRDRINKAKQKYQ